MSERRSLLGRAVRRLKRSVNSVRDTARHPDRPPGPHPEASPTSAEDADAAAGNLRDADDVAWYLAGEDDVDGWENTDGREG